MNQGMNQEVIGKWSAIIGLAVTGTWLKIPHTVQVLILMMGLDILSGIIAAIATHTLNSSLMVRGLFKKLAAFPVLAMLHVVEKPLSLPFEFEAVAAMAFIVYEAMSIVENSAIAGLPVPSVIVKALGNAKIKTATPEEIHQEFSGSDRSQLTVRKSSAIVKTPDSQPDLKVDKKVTLLEEEHVEPVVEVPKP